MTEAWKKESELFAKGGWIISEVNVGNGRTRIFETKDHKRWRIEYEKNERGAFIPKEVKEERA